MWRKLRILILLLILLFVALDQYFDRVVSTDWDTPLAGRGHSDPWPTARSSTAEFVAACLAEAFRSLEHSFASRHAVRRAPRQPVRFTLAPALDELPPCSSPRAGSSAR